MDALPAPWLLPLARGIIALNVFALLFLLARLRWRERDDGAADNGLD